MTSGKDCKFNSTHSYMQKKGLKLFIYYLLDFFFTTYRKIFSGVLWAKPPNVDVLAYPTRAGHTEKKLLSDIQSGRRFVVHVLSSDNKRLVRLLFHHILCFFQLIHFDF